MQIFCTQTSRQQDAYCDLDGVQGQEAASGVSTAGKAVLTQRRALTEAAALMEPQCTWLADVLAQLGLHEKIASSQALQERPRQQTLLNFTLQGLPRLREAFQVLQANNTVSVQETLHTVVPPVECSGI